MPKSVEDVDNFKRDKKAQHTGADVMKVVQDDKNAVVVDVSGHGATRRAPRRREHEPEALPPPEIAPPTGAMNLGKDGDCAAAKGAHRRHELHQRSRRQAKAKKASRRTSSTWSTAAIWPTANKEKKGMEKSAKTEPVAVQKFAQQAGSEVDDDLKQEETKRRGELTSQAQGRACTATKTKQQRRQEPLWKRSATRSPPRSTASTQTAQDKVKKKLADLETQSMKRFDDGNNKATQGVRGQRQPRDRCLQR